MCYAAVDALASRLFCLYQSLPETAWKAFLFKIRKKIKDNIE